MNCSSSFLALLIGQIDLDYCDFKLFALETNRDDSIIFEIAPKYCISESFINYDVISSKGILAHSSRYNGHLN